VWMLFGNKTRVRPVPGGRELERYCPDCKTVRTFQECDVADNVSATDSELEKMLAELKAKLGK
jgi:hypothetical protein